jgi:sigma-B regulation protein RsbU (phosphoserine phosphatase)
MDHRAPRILLVDDDPAVLLAYRRILHDYGPLQASDGVEARKILSETVVDIVVCDLGMPRMNGLDLMQWARDQCPHPLWIVVSGDGTFDAVAQALKLGAFDFISKPLLSPLQLQTVVANAAHRQALFAERTALLRCLTDNNLRLAQSHRSLEVANAALRDQKAALAQDLRRAERIVQALLPRQLCTLERMHVNVAYRPSESVGGDFHGAAMQDDRHLAVYVADVAGHGVSAALLAVLFDQRLSAANAQIGLRAPAALLADLNRRLLDPCRASGLFVTVAYALIDTVERTATFASAGHPAAIALRRSGMTEHLEKTGPALGLTADASYEERRISLADGDRLLLYTDGVTGAMAQHAPGLDTILAAVASGEQDGAAVLDQLLTWSERGEHADDDMTLLLLTASRGVSTFDDERPTAKAVRTADCAVSTASSDGTTWVVVRGPATWKDAGALRDACMEALDASRAVVVDLSDCTMLDSTMLGTLHEIVVRAGPRASLQVQGVTEEIRGLFVELAMAQVIASLAPSPRPVPAVTCAPRSEGDATKGLVLHAHELLAELSASNAEQFQPVVDALRREAAP